MSSLSIAASIDDLFFLLPHCSSLRPRFSAFCIICFANKNLRAVLKSVWRRPMILSMWILRTPGFFSSMTSISLHHRSFANPYMNGRLIIMHRNSAKSSCSARAFQTV
eukprot:scaffold10733_cov47-Cyclotella_meneghiniana.AAC.3